MMGAPEGEKRQVDKIHAHRGGVDAQFIAPPLTHTKLSLQTTVLFY